MTDFVKEIARQAKRINEQANEIRRLKQELQKHQQLVNDQYVEAVDDDVDCSNESEQTCSDLPAEVNKYINGKTYIPPATIRLLVNVGIINRGQASILRVLYYMHVFRKKNSNFYASYESIGKPYGISKNTVIKTMGRRGKIFERTKNGVIGRNGHPLFKWKINPRFPEE